MEASPESNHSIRLALILKESRNYNVETFDSIYWLGQYGLPWLRSESNMSTYSRIIDALPGSYL